MWVITIVAVGVIGASFGISHFLGRHMEKSVAKNHAIGETVAISVVLVWVVLIFLMAFGVLRF